MAKLLNTFLVGADPELIFLDGARLINAQGVGVETANFFGFDHGGYVVEPHPTPNLSVRQVCNNIRASMDYLHYHFPDYKYRAGAHVQTAQRVVTLGGHVHLDVPRLSIAQITAMDIFTGSLEHLDILPSEECRTRAAGGAYGHKGDVRTEHGHVEYRSMCSWLFDRKIAMLSMTGIKLCAVAPETLPFKGFDSLEALQKWIGGFSASDDDARWIIEHDYFGGSLVAKPDNSVLSAWKTSVDRGKALKEAFVAKQVAVKLAHAKAAAAARRAQRLANEWA